MVRGQSVGCAFAFKLAGFHSPPLQENKIENTRFKMALCSSELDLLKDLR